MLPVVTVGSSGGAHRQCSHRGSQWKRTRCGKGDGRCRRSPGTWAGPQDGPGVPEREAGAGAAEAGGPGPVRGGSRGTAGSGSATTRTCGPRRCSTRSASSAMTGSYPSFTRALRTRGLRPGCEDCAAAGDAGGVRGHRSPGGRRDAVGLGRAAGSAAVVGVGEGRAPAGRGAGALGCVAGRARGVRAAALPGRVAARGLRAAGRGDPPVAVRPDDARSATRSPGT